MINFQCFTLKKKYKFRVIKRIADLIFLRYSNKFFYLNDFRDKSYNLQRII